MLQIVCDGVICGRNKLKTGMRIFRMIQEAASQNAGTIADIDEMMTRDGLSE
jgi:hypothetical protein